MAFLFIETVNFRIHHKSLFIYVFSVTDLLSTDQLSQLSLSSVCLAVMDAKLLVLTSRCSLLLVLLLLLLVLLLLFFVLLVCVVVAHFLFSFCRSLLFLYLQYPLYCISLLMKMVQAGVSPSQHCQKKGFLPLIIILLQLPRHGTTIQK